ncbi:MAG: BCCT family transporter, partial [Novosphingobium sp.]
MTDISMEERRGALHRVNRPLFALSGGFILIFCLYALIDIDGLSAAVDWGFAVSARYFGLYWQILLLATFLISLVLCVLPGGRAKLGGLPLPEFKTFNWASMIMCTLLAGGGVFWAAGEPIAHFLSTPPLFGDAPADLQARANIAMAQSFLHWGFLAWAILGSLSGVMLMHYHYDKGLPLAPRTLLYPVFGDRAINGPIGLIADASCIIAVVAGTVGPIGFLGLQMSYGLSALTGIPDNFATQAVVVMALVAVYTLSAVSGLAKGIQMLSTLNVVLALGLLVFLLVFGPTSAMLTSFFGGMGVYFENFFQMS